MPRHHHHAQSEHERNDAADNVDAVNTRQNKVAGKKHVSRRIDSVMELVGVFNGLDTHEDKAAENRDDQKELGLTGFTDAGPVNRQRHRETTEDQHESIGESIFPVQVSRFMSEAVLDVECAPIDIPVVT